MWAPAPESISLVIERNGQPQELRLETGPGGYRDVFVTDAAEGTRYWYRVNGDLLPDPASRYQPDGPFAASQVVDPGRYVWK